MKWLQTFPGDGPIYTYTDPEWQVQVATYTSCSRNLQLSPSSGSSSHYCPRWPPGKSRLYMNPYGDCLLGSMLGKGDARHSPQRHPLQPHQAGQELGVACENETVVNEFRQLLPADRRQVSIARRIEGHRPNFKAHHLPTKNGDGDWSSELTARWYELKCFHSSKQYREVPAGTKAAAAEARGPRGSAGSPSPSSTPLMLPTTGRRQRSATLGGSPGLPFLSEPGLWPPRPCQGAASRDVTARAQQFGRVYRGGKKAPQQEISLLYRATLSTGSWFMLAKHCRVLLTRLRFAHPHRNTPQCPERALRNVNDIVGYDAPRTPFADVSNSPLLRRSGS